MNLNELACWSCRKKWWQCSDRIRYILLDILGSKLVQCTFHEDVEKCKRITEMQVMLDFVTKKKAELERKLKAEEADRSTPIPATPEPVYETSKCPVCGGNLEPDTDYPDDLLCGHCWKAFDRTTLEEIPWNP